ncbi:MAG: hypothetical protein IKE16_07085 [Solobacterium sp.]|nr:hypothetical protein [Solobacterium sp.]MBR2794398.1 hypothetical protein [Solobacterium sp.]
MEKNNISEETMSQISGGEVSGYENPGEYKYTVMETIKTQGNCPCCGAALFRVNKRGDYKLEEEFAKRHLMICEPFRKHYKELGATEF